MGTDVHMVFQKQTKLTKDITVWSKVDDNYNQDRQYTLFGWLANVRNGVGFANIYTGDPITPISLPRGLPEDLDLHKDSYQEYSCQGVWLGDHSHSWLMGSEVLQAYDRLEPICRVGVIPYNDYVEWDKVSQPYSYSSGVFGRNVVVLSEEQINEGIDVYADKEIYVQVEWIVSSEQLKREFSSLVDEVKRLTSLHGEIRLVFGFDS